MSDGPPVPAVRRPGHLPAGQTARPLALRSELRRRLTSAIATTRPVTLAFVGVDDLDGLDGRFGRRCPGVRLARRLSDLLHGYGLLGRAGRQDFFVLCPSTTASPSVLRLLGAALEATLLVGGRAIQATASIGVLVAGSGESAEQMLDRAAQTMARARRGPPHATRSAPGGQHLRQLTSTEVVAVEGAVTALLTRRVCEDEARAYEVVSDRAYRSGTTLLDTALAVLREGFPPGPVAQAGRPDPPATGRQRC